MLAVRVFWILVTLALVIMGARVLGGDVSLESLGREQEYRYEQSVRIEGAPAEFRLTMFLPREGGRTTVLEERLETGDLALSLQDDPGGRSLQLSGVQLQGRHEARYTAALQVQPLHFELDDGLRWEELEFGEGERVAATELVQTGHPAVVRQLASMLELPPDSALVWDARAWRDGLRTRGLGPTEVLRRIFHACRDDLAPATFSGTTDALTALRLGEASCGGKSRLLLAYARTLGLGGELVGGVILGDPQRKRTSHVWVELELLDEFVPFDPLNDHFARLPGNYLTLYRGDRPLIRHSRGLAFDYGFASRPQKVPALWHTRPGDEGLADGAGGRIPLLRRGQFSLLLLAPFALLLAVFVRQVIGLELIGTFLPVLLGFSLVQTGWAVGLAQIAVALLLGVGLRYALGHLNLLHMPRAAVMISFLVMVFLGVSFVLDRLGVAPDRGGLVLPMAALAMTVERFAVTAMDRGTGPALVLLGQTLLLAAACSLVLSVPLFLSLTVAFPEVLLLVVAEIVMIGHYRGLRLRERWRFRRLLGGEGGL